MLLTSCQETFTEIMDLTPSSTPPASPEYGQAWLDSSTNPPTIKIWNGSAWVDQLGDAVEDLEGKFQDVTSKLSQAQQDILEQAGLIDSQGDLIAGNTAAIESHTETLSTHSTQIKANEDAIKLKVDTQTYTKDQSTINATIASNLSTAKSYAESQAASAKQAAITAAATDAQKKADAAKSAAISTAATDAQKKADAALSSAKTYTNAQISTVNTNLSKATSAIEVLQDQIALKVEQTDIDTAVAEVKLYTDQSKGENLVLNGDGSLGGTIGWSSNTKVSSDAAPDAYSSFDGTTQSIYAKFSNGEVYDLSFYLKNKTGNTDVDYFCMVPYDSDGLMINYHLVSFVGLTKLTKDLKDGDTVVYCEDLSGWNTSNADSYSHWRCIGVHDYKNKSGYTYPPGTYTRNVYSNMFADGSAINKTAKTITLSKAWAGGTKKTGTYIAQHYSGGTYIYPGFSGKVPPSEWTKYSATIQESTDKRLPYTAFVTFRMNRGAAWISNLVFKRQSVTVKEVEEKISTAKSEIKQTTDSIKQSVTSLQSIVNTHTTQIAGKADTTTVKALTDRTTSLETSVSGITGRVSSVESTVKTHTTELGTVDSRINTAKSAAISSAATDAQKKADAAKTAAISSAATDAQKKADAAKSAAISTAATDAQKKADAALSSAKSYTNTQITTVNKTITDKVAEIKATTDSITSRVSKTEQVAIASLQGKMLYTDPTFKSGTNSTKVYNNSSGGAVTLTRVAKSSDCPTTSGYMLQIQKNSGASSPGHGGFSFGTPSRANAIFLTKIIAKIPSGSTIFFASNSAGTGYKSEWLTSTAGTGKWQEYICKVTCGSSGTFSTTNYFYINGGTAPITWYVAFATVWDVTETNSTESRLAAAEQKITADAIISTVQSTINTAKTEAINSANASTDTKLKSYSTTSQMNSAITQKADSITSTVSKTYATISTVNGKVDKTAVISAINQTAESVKISASKIELTGKVTFSMLATDAQGKINTATSTANTAKSTADTAKTTADSAKTTATTAQSTANTVKSTVDSNKANWDKGLTAYNWTNSYGTRTNNLYTMVTKWTDGAVSATTEINGGWIKTNTITADKIGVGDFTNYVADPGFENDIYAAKQYFSFVTNIKHTGKKSVKISGNPTGWPVLEVSKWFHVTNGDKIFVGWWAYRENANANGGINIAIRNADGTNYQYDITGKVEMLKTDPNGKWKYYSYVGTVGTDGTAVVEVKVAPGNGTMTGAWYVDDIEVRKMATGKLIVDGSVTAAKIKVSDLSALNATIGGWTIGAHYLSTKVGSNYSVLKNDGDVAFATASPSASDTTGASCQIWHDGHISLGDTKNSKTRTELYGDRWNMYNDQGFAFRLVSAGGIEFYGDPKQNPTPYMDWHYNGDTGDYSVRLRCTGYDTLQVEGGSLNTGSDERLKKNIASMSDKYLALFDGLNPITFQYREHTAKTFCGFSAQEVERSATRAGLDISELAMYAVDDQGYRSLAYQEFTAVNTLAIKRNKREIDRLKERMLAAEKRADTAEARLNQVQMLLNSAYALMAEHGIKQNIS